MSLQDTYNQIDQLKAELDKLRPLKAEDERRIMDKFRLDWNFHSSNIEGNTLTYGETKALLLFGITADAKPIKDHIEIQGHDEAVKWLEEVIKQERPLTENFIRELHKLILKEPYEVDAITPDGKPTKKLIEIGGYKKTPNHVKTKTGEIFRFADPEATPSMMSDLMEFYNTQRISTETNFVWLASVFHYKFISIHPFDDGNGRMARILMNFILMQNGYPPVVIKSNNKEAYITALQKADVGDLEAFVIYIGNELINSLALMIKGAKGEEIDELEDLDKKIALLKNKIENLNTNDEAQLEFSQDIAYKLYYNSIHPLLIAILTQVAKFNDFYISSSSNLSVDGTAHGNDIDKNFTYVQQQMADKNKNPVRTLNLDIVLKGFKKAGTSTMSDYISVKISFHEFAYEILVSPSNQKVINLKKLYHQQLSDMEIKELANKTGQAVYNKIEDNISRLQNPIQ